MIAYLDSSVLVRAYLPDEDGYEAAVALLSERDAAIFTGTWTRVEVAGALVRAARVGRGSEHGLLLALGADLGPGGPVTVVQAPQADVELRALELVCEHGLRAMDAWHLAVAQLVMPSLATKGEAVGFASRDARQSEIAEQLGFLRV